MYTNADQLTSSKKIELEDRIRLEKPAIIAVCEMKPKNAKIRSAEEYAVPGYTLYDVNLDVKVGRGIAIYVHDSIDKSTALVKPDINFQEGCLLKIKLRGGDSLLFACLYRSPTPSETSDDNNLNLNRIMRHVCNEQFTHKCFVGDFNFKNINWSNYSTNESEESKEYRFLETVRDCFIHQHISKPTRIRGNNDPSLLDLVLSDEPLQVSNIKHHAPLGNSDHCVITFNFHCYADINPPQPRYCFQKADFQAMNDNLHESNWSETFLSSATDKSIEELWNLFKNKLMDLRKKHVPFESPTSWSSKGSFPISKTLQATIRQKHRLHRHWINANQSTKEAAREVYTKSRNKVKTLLRQAKRRFEKDISVNAKNIPKKFWSYVRRKLKTKAGIAPLQKISGDNDSLVFLDLDKANILQNQFSSVFTQEPDDEMPQFMRRVEHDLDDIIVSKEMVEAEIISLNPNKSCGPDEIEARILKELVNHIAGPLAFILNKSLEVGSVPDDWTAAIVSPIFKKGNKNKAENYRPISLTSIACKILESMVKKKIVSFFTDNNLFSNSQHGFIGGRSTTTQLLAYLDLCTEAYANGETIDCIYLDFAKAFDTVPHKRLLSKLKSWGINGNVLRWIHAFLSNRSQTVKVNGAKSESAPVVSGIPQGSVLGPILFVIFINDLPDSIVSGSFLFADDTKLFRTIRSRDDTTVLQSDLDHLMDWSSKWLLKFNASKCHVLTIGAFENIVCAHRYTMGDLELEHVFEEKDLGVIIDSELKFDDHISSKVNKANSIIGLIRRSFSFLDPLLFKKLYVTFARPHLEYAQSVWSPHLKKHINKLENVQRRATKLVDGFKKLSYEERLRRLDLPTLVYRRRRGDMIELFKHFHVYDRAAISRSFRQAVRINRKHHLQLIRNVPTDGSRGRQSNSFYYRVCNIWNNLPSEVVDVKTINAFKMKLDDAWSEQPLRFNIDGDLRDDAMYHEES